MGPALYKSLVGSVNNNLVGDLSQNFLYHGFMDKEAIVQAVRHLKRDMLRLGWSQTEVASHAKRHAASKGVTLQLSQQSVAHFLSGNGKRLPSWLQFIGGAIEEHDRAEQRREQVEAIPRHPALVPIEQSDLPPTRNASANDNTVEIVSLDLSLSMGPGTMIDDFVEAEPVKFDLGMVRAITRTPPNRLRLVKGIGESMEPTIRTSDQVMIDINDRQLSRINGIYWIDHLGMHGIKRLRAAGRGKVMIISDNPVVENFEVDVEDLRIEGRAIWYAREL